MPDGRAGDGVVAGSLVDVEHDTRGRAVDVAGDGDLVGGAGSRATARDGDLEAGRIELNTRVGPG